LCPYDCLFHQLLLNSNCKTRWMHLLRILYWTFLGCERFCLRIKVCVEYSSGNANRLKIFNENKQLNFQIPSIKIYPIALRFQNKSFQLLNIKNFAVFCFLIKYNLILFEEYFLLSISSLYWTSIIISLQRPVVLSRYIIWLYYDSLNPDFIKGLICSPDKTG
jgi:hypothetical protein